MIESPAVHVDQWKHWSFGEGRRRISRIVPPGCALTLENGHIQYRGANAQTYDVQPLTADEAAWHQANFDKLSIGPKPKRQHVVDRDSPELQFETAGDRYLAQTSESIGFYYLQSFWGVSNLQETTAGEFCAWPGLTTPSGVGGHFWLLQPVIEHTPGDAPNKWNIVDEAFDGINNIPYKTNDIPIIEGIGFWGVVRWYAGNGWHVGSYRGTRGNAGPAFGRPFTDGLPLYDPSGRTFGPFTVAQCAIEIQAPAPACSDISATVAFGGVVAEHGSRNQGAVNWVGQWLGASGTYCNPGSTISNPTANPTMISIYFLDH